ncbi:MAG: YtxH domain-containing protein [Bacteroidia bacterium]
MEHENNHGKVIGALLVGAVIGGILGVLFAPDKGSVTRKKIAGSTEDLTASLKERIKAILEEVKASDEQKEKTNEVAANGKVK